MKNSLFVLIVLLTITSCQPTKNGVLDKSNAAIEKDTVRIANEELEYEVLIIEPGFSTWLNTIAFPRGHYSQKYLEQRNIVYVSEWNSRVLQPMRFDPGLYEMNINYDPIVNYGYEVNYLIYNYMIYFQNTYKQNLGGVLRYR